MGVAFFVFTSVQLSMYKMWGLTYIFREKQVVDM